MHPASTRATRKGIKVTFGPLNFTVDVYGGNYNPPSSTTVCVGDGHGHEPTKLVSEKWCPVCSTEHEHTVGVTKKAHHQGRNKLIPIEAEDSIVALQASEEFRDTMNIVRVDVDALEAFTLTSGKVYWLVGEETDAIYCGLIGCLGDYDSYAYVVRWASQKNVKFYRLVARGGLLGMMELTPGTTLRAAPIEPPPPSDDGKALVKMVLAQLPEIGSEELPAITENPHQKALEEAAIRASEEGVSAVKRRGQKRSTFGDEVAQTELEALLAGAILD
jgi:hypothetical protein